MTEPDDFEAAGAEIAPLAALATTDPRAAGAGIMALGQKLQAKFNSEVAVLNATAAALKAREATLNHLEGEFSLLQTLVQAKANFLNSAFNEILALLESGDVNTAIERLRFYQAPTPPDAN